MKQSLPTSAPSGPVISLCLCLVWVLLMKSSLGSVNFPAECQMCPRCCCGWGSAREAMWEQEMEVAERGRRALGSPLGHLCLPPLPWEILLRGSFLSWSSCCSAPQRWLKLFDCRSQRALNLQNAAGFSGWHSVIAPRCIFTLMCPYLQEWCCNYLYGVPGLWPLSLRAPSTNPFICDCLVLTDPPPVCVLLCCCLQGVGSGVNVSPHTAAADAFPSKPAIDFLYYYFCSICDRLEVSFLIKLLQSSLWLWLDWNQTDNGEIPLLASPFIHSTVS